MTKILSQLRICNMPNMPVIIQSNLCKSCSGKTRVNLGSLHCDEVFVKFG